MSKNEVLKKAFEEAAKEEIIICKVLEEDKHSFSDDFTRKMEMVLHIE